MTHQLSNLVIQNLELLFAKALLASSIKGKNQMPARGGDASLSDAEMKAAIEEMLKQTGL